jgi:hypothetical protein
MPNNNEIITEKVKQFVANKEMFTSVDISNSIKQDGTWIMNREVAAFLRQYNFSGDAYEHSLIAVTKVNGQSARANVYYPDYADPANYTKTSQTTIKKAAVVSQPATLIVPQNIQPQTKLYNHVIRERFRIPKKVVESVGLKPGDKVDIAKLDSSLFNNFSADLTVTRDGRINIMARYLKQQRTNISVYESNGKIYFQ